MSLFKHVEESLARGGKSVLATVIARAGSAPRDVGAKMLVSEDGTQWGTIGGGRLEFSAFEEAKLMMEKDVPRMLHIRMDAKEVASDGMICGGNVDVLLEPVLERHTGLYNRLDHLEKIGKKGVLVTVFDEGVYHKTLIEDDLKINGDDLPESDRERFLRYIHETKPFADAQVVVEPLHVSPVLYIFGAGHVSQFIAKLARMVGFSVTVIDDREEFANRERFPDADEIIVDGFQKVFEGLAFTGKEFVAIVTRGHQHDADVLKETLKRPVRYAGMIGSKRKVAMVANYLKEQGFDDATIQKVYAPIGLPIHAETPEEIAVSIVAQLIQVRGE